MITDIALIPIRDRAEAGDPEAQRQMAIAYADRVGVVRNGDDELLRYSLMLAEHHPDTIPIVSYGSLLASIGDMLMRKEEYYEAIEWYRRSKDYIMKTYLTHVALDLIKHLGIKESMHRAIVENLKSYQQR
ncbi:MAG: hypothetical protein DHS20C13_22120 [Thermodesulfobacteriota bacterium]|nr:MAG: hypothetical protein DHS20C13_22120 [Thermodesulfobacteriota bacterium]